MNVTFVEGDTGSSLVFMLADLYGNPIDLTGATVTFAYQIGSHHEVTGSCVVNDAANGICQYNWGAGELKPGEIMGNVVAAYDGGVYITSEVATAKVRARIGTLS